MSSSSTAAFFDAWQTYQKVVAANHMFHREFASQLSQFLRARFGSDPFSFLDLGCGDAASLAPVLKGLVLERYEGMDLSQPALTLAAKNLAGLSCPVALRKGDISAALTGEAEKFDVIYSSFALHHLTAEQKAAFFRRAADCLDGAGLVLLVDVVRDEDESLELYYRHYCAWLRASFTAVDTDELDLICDHIVHNDLPEPFSALAAMARAAGLGKAQAVARYNWHQLLCFARD